MSDKFFEQPILNSPYEYPFRHWELDESGQPTQRISEMRRPAEFITHSAIINSVRAEVNKWRALIVITNYHALKLRERMELSKSGRLLLQGRGGARSARWRLKAKCFGANWRS